MTSFMRLCPRCRKVSPVSEATWHSVCTHCGFLFFPIMERRSSPRIKKNCPAIVRIGKDTYYGYTLDVSDSGAKIIYSGAPRGKHAVLEISADALGIRRQAEVVWEASRLDDAVCAGIRFL